MNSFGKLPLSESDRVFRRNVPRSTEILKNQALKACEKHVLQNGGLGARMLMLPIVIGGTTKQEKHLLQDSSYH
jgi:hypothetical protein